MQNYYNDSLEHELATAGSTIYITNFDKRISNVVLYQLFNQFFPSQILGMEYHEEKSGQEGYCFMTFTSTIVATSALSIMNGRDIFGRKLKVNWAAGNTTLTNRPVIGSSFSIYVGDLGHDVDDTMLYNSFKPFGEVLSCRIVRDPDTALSKGFGFVVYRHQMEAEEAIRVMNGQQVGSRYVKVSWGTRSKTTTTQNVSYTEAFNATAANNTTLYIGNTPETISEQHLISFFEPYGKVVECKMFPEKKYAFIKMDTHESASTAIVKVNGLGVENSVLKVWWSRENIVAPSSVGHAAAPIVATPAGFMYNPGNFQRQ